MRTYTIDLNIILDTDYEEDDVYESVQVDFQIPDDMEFNPAKFIRAAASRVRELIQEMKLDDDPTVCT